MKHFATTMLAAFATLAAGSRIRMPFEIQYNMPAEASPSETAPGSPDESVHSYPPGMAITTPVHTQGSGGLFLCINDHFNPPCEHLDAEFGECINVRQDWNDKISAVGPDGGTKCTFYRDYYCGGPTLGPIGYGGVPDLRDVNFNDVISSWKCYAAE